MREPGVILARAAALMDYTEPVAVLLVAVLHFVGEQDKPAACVSALLEAVPAGNWLVISHVTGEFSADGAARSAAEYRQVAPGATVRSRSMVLGFSDGLKLAEPGLVRVSDWRPDAPFTGDAAEVWFLGGAGRKTAARM